MKGALLVLKKEMYYWTKDRRTLFLTLFFPLVLYPLLFGIMTKMSIKDSQRLSSTVTRVAIDDPGGIITESLFKEGSGYERFIGSIDNIPLALNQEKIHVFVRVPEYAEVTMKSGKPIDIEITYDPSKDISKKGFLKIQKFLKDIDASIVVERLNKFKISPEILEPTRLAVIKTTGANEEIGRLIGLFLPYFLLISMYAGAMQFGAEITAGEKERGTLLSLLTTRLSRLEIMQGKMLAIFCVSIIGIAMNLLALGLGGFTAGNLALSERIEQTKSLASTIGQANMVNIDLQQILTPQAILLTLGLLIPLGLLFSAIILTIGAQSKSVREANVAMVPGIFVVLAIGVFSLSPGIEKLRYLSFVPLMNITVAIRKLFTGQFVAWEYFITLFMTLLLSWAMVRLSGRLLKRENVLFKS
ncbi:MAG: ABC transporter permease [Holophagaceae bacterium]